MCLFDRKTASELVLLSALAHALDIIAFGDFTYDKKKAEREALRSVTNEAQRRRQLRRITGEVLAGFIPELKPMDMVMAESKL